MKIIQEAKAAEMEVEVIDLKDVPCKVREDGVFDCTSDPSLRARMEVVKTITVNRTKYSRADSCHNPKRVGDKIWCLTAIGRDTVEGVTVCLPTRHQARYPCPFQGHDTRLRVRGPLLDVG